MFEVLLLLLLWCFTLHLQLSLIRCRSKRKKHEYHREGDRSSSHALDSSTDWIRSHGGWTLTFGGACLDADLLAAAWRRLIALWYFSPLKVKCGHFSTRVCRLRWLKWKCSTSKLTFFFFFFWNLVSGPVSYVESLRLRNHLLSANERPLLLYSVLLEK